jgi:hypothetical protein
MGPSAPSAVTAAYLEHFTDHDVALLAADAPLATIGDRRHLLRTNPDGLEGILSSRRLFEAVFSAPKGSDPLLEASPFFVFSVAVHQAAVKLQSTGYVSERLGPGRRAPLFDVEELRGFVAMPWHRFFLAELLASYTHVASGSVVVSTSRGLRRQRFSELDPVRFAGLLDVVSEAERPGILRRLGDLALFLTGVFPDYVAKQGFGPIAEGRLLRASGVPSAAAMGLPREPGAAAFGDRGAVELLEQLGQRWYGAAAALLSDPLAENVAVLRELPRRFRQARRVLGVVTEQLLFAHRDQWFGLAN